MTFYNDSPEAERAMMLAMRLGYEHRTQLALFSLCTFCIFKAHSLLHMYGGDATK